MLPTISLMKKAYLLTTIIVAAACIFASGRATGAAIAVEAGGLRTAIAGKTDATELTITGTLNLADFEFLALEMPQLRSLDLSGTRIAAFKGESSFTGRTSSAADVLPAYALLGMKLENLALPKEIKAIGEAALAGLEIKSLTIPTTVTSVGDNAFNRCTALTSVSLPASVTAIGAGSFKGCTSLTEVQIAGMLDSIPSGAFAGCTKLKSVKLPATVKSIGSQAFNGCEALQNLTVPPTVTSIGDLAFYGSGINNLDLTACNSLKSLGKWSFAQCRRLASTKMPASLTTIGDGAFFNDAAMKLKSIPADMKSIPDFAFTTVDGSATMFNGTSVETIGKYALADWTGMQQLRLPSTLTSLDDGAMANWSDLKELYVETIWEVPLLGADVWGNINKSNVKLLVADENMKNAFLEAPQWQDFAVEVVSSDIDTSIEPAGADEPLKIRVDGTTIHITAPRNIAGVQVYDIAGRSYTLPSSADGTTLSLDTSAWDSNVLIIRVILVDGTASAVKLHR